MGGGAGKSQPILPAIREEETLPFFQEVARARTDRALNRSSGRAAAFGRESGGAELLHDIQKDLPKFQPIRKGKEPTAGKAAERALDSGKLGDAIAENNLRKDIIEQTSGNFTDGPLQQDLIGASIEETPTDIQEDTLSLSGTSDLRGSIGDQIVTTDVFNDDEDEDETSTTLTTDQKKQLIGSTSGDLKYH